MRFRTFKNDDPPKLFNLCRQVDLGRGAARPESVHAFEVAVFSLPYFDPTGLIIAEEDGQVVGFVHAGFGFKKDLSGLDQTIGVICWLVVRKTHQNQGIGRRLIELAENYLRENGAKEIQAGQSRYRDPFYFGLYGGARCSGFLKSDSQADPFLQKLGYRPVEESTIYQRDLTAARDPMNVRLMTLRRKTELLVSEKPAKPTRWWWTHFGNIESMFFSLVERSTQKRIASLTIVGLDHFIGRWNERVIGLVDIYVEPEYRTQGYGTTLIVESLRRLKTNFITRAEVHVDTSIPGAIKAIETAGFDPVDVAIVYQKPDQSAESSE